MVFLSVAVLLAASIPSTVATTTHTTANTTSVLSAASPTSLTSICGAASNVCPSCNGLSINDAAGSSYKVYCSGMLNSTDRYIVANAKATTDRLCREACDELDGCLGASYSAGGECILATGLFLEIASVSGYTAFRKAAAVSPSSSLASSTSGPTSVHTRSSTLTSPSGALVRPTGGVISNNTSGCAATAISCPSCDSEEVTDSQGKTYKVFCDNQLFAESDYSVQQWLSPAGCLHECDSYTWCKGSTFWPQGNCQLAKGSDVFPQLMPGYTAFLLVASPTHPPQTSPSRYPSAQSYSARSSSRTTRTFQPSTTSSSTKTSPSCTPTAARCPVCDGQTVPDKLNQTYRIDCGSQPICLDIAEAPGSLSLASQEGCRQDCDADPICLAAIWNSGTCHLCEGSIEDFLAFHAPADYVVFLAVPANNVTNLTLATTHYPGSSFTTTPGPLLSSTEHAVSVTGTKSSLLAVPSASDSSAGSHTVDPPGATTSTSTSTSTLTSTSTSTLKEDGTLYAQTWTSATSSQTTPVAITGTVSVLTSYVTLAAVASETSSAAFVPPLTDGSVSFAVPGGQTAAVG